MIPPRRYSHRPRLTLGQILASVAVSALPIALVVRATDAQGTAADLLVGGLLCLLMTFFCEFVFWMAVVPTIPGLRRALGQPSWFASEIEVDPTGVKWIDDDAARRPRGGEDGGGIRFLE